MKNIKNNMKTIFNKLPLYALPMWFKLLWAKAFIRMLKSLTNDIILYNELRLWIETNGRPTTSNPNYWVNKK